MVYRNVVNLLKTKINCPAHNIGDLLPSENELARMYCVSRNTLRKALKHLEDEGMVERRHGSGTRIKNKHFQLSPVRLGGFTELALNEGKTPGSQLIRFELQAASEEIANGLDIQRGSPVYYTRRLRFIDNIAVQLEETWLSATRFPGLSAAHMEKSKFAYLEKECGVKITGCYETVMPVIPTEEQARLLHISTRDPILKCHTQAIDEQRCPVDYSILYTNTFEFQVKYYFPQYAR